LSNKFDLFNILKIKMTRSKIVGIRALLMTVLFCNHDLVTT